MADKRMVYVTSAQAKAAAAIVSQNARTGKFVSKGMRKVANAKPGVITANAANPTPRVAGEARTTAPALRSDPGPRKPE